MLSHIVYLNIVEIFFIVNDIHQIYLNFKHPDLLFFRLFTSLYFILSNLLYLFSSYGFLLGKNKPPIPFKLNKEALRSSGISDRENEVLHLIVEGKSNHDIATLLFVSISTVKTHNSNIFRKLDVQNRYELLSKISH